MESGNKTIFIGGAVFVLLMGAGAWFFIAKAPAPEAVPAVPAPAAAPVTAAPLAPSEPLPALDESDDWVRGKAGGLTADARFKDWLKTSNLLPRWAASVNIVAAGKVPTDALSFLRPRKKFVPQSKDARLFVDSKSYGRYDAVADVFSSIDAPAAATFFKTTRPLIDQAWNSLGEGKGDVLDGVARAAHELLAAPTLPDRAELHPSEKGIVYVYADDALEKRSPAQKQLMRMGPRNQLKIQAKVRELALALGVTAEKLQ
jgi:hypothetical protein